VKNIFLITGLPRSGKTLLKNLLSLSDQIAVTPTEFFYFRYFNKKNFYHRGSYLDNVNFLFEKCSISKKWLLNKENFNFEGVNQKDLYLNIIDNYIKNHHKNKNIFLDNSPDSISYFNDYINWFGENFKCIYIVRNKIDNFNSFKNKNYKEDHEKLIEDFKYKWDHSFIIAQNLKIKYTNSLKIIYYENLVTDTYSCLREIFLYLNLNINEDIIKKIKNYSFKTNSSFNIKDKGSIYSESIGRKNTLSKDELLRLNGLNIIDSEIFSNDFTNFSLDLKKNNTLTDKKVKNFDFIIKNLIYDLSFKNLIRLLIKLNKKIFFKLIYKIRNKI
jgi:hypothetical protein